MCVYMLINNRNIISFTFKCIHIRYGNIKMPKLNVIRCTKCPAAEPSRKLLKNHTYKKFSNHMIFLFSLLDY